MLLHHRMHRMENLFIVTGIIIIAYLLVALYLYLFQRKILYLPDKKLDPPKDYGLQGVKTLKLTTKDNITLTAWHYDACGPEQHTIVYFHGNAAHLGDRAYKFKAFIEKGFNVMAISYRGYGTSQGEPTEEGIYTDARTAIDYLTTTKHIPSQRLIYYGESLGSGVATQMALEHPPYLVVLEAPYTSIVNIAKEKYPFIPASLLLKDRFETDKKIGHIKTALLIFHGLEDNVIPPKHGTSLFEIANHPKHLILKDTVDHTSFNADELAFEIENFLSKL